MTAAFRWFTLILLLAIIAPISLGADTASPEFAALPDLPDPLGFGGPIVGAHDGSLIVAGGANFPTPLADGGAKVWHDRIFVLRPGDDAWRVGQTLPRPLAYAACASTPRGIVVAGGSDADRVYADVVLLRWNGADGRVEFEDLPALPVPCAFGAAEAIGNTVYVLGGKQAKDDVDLSGGFWRLDLDTAQPTWEALPPYPGGPRYKMATAVHRGPDGTPELYMFSGSRTTRTDAGDPRFAMFTDAYRFTPATGVWTRLADLPVLDDPRDIPGKAKFANDRWPINAACAMAYDDTRILTFSGSTGRYILDEEGSLVPATERPFFADRVLAYDTVADTWTDTFRMPQGVVTTRAVVWNGRIVIPSGEVKPGIRTPRVSAIRRSAASAVTLRTIDSVVLGFYLLIMVAVGVYFARRETSTEEFFLAGRRIPWWAAGLSIFGTQLSAITFMAIPATAYGSDWRRFVGHLMLLPILVIVITCFLPFFRRLDITTAYEYLESRFSASLRLAGGLLFILFQLGRMGIVVLLPAIALAAVTGVDVYLCIALMGVLATAYTALGGISAVIWTDVLQVFVLLGGALVCLVIAIADAGGVSAAIDVANASDKFRMFDWQWSPSDLVAWVLIVGFLFTNLVPYSTDQTVVQRYLTTRDETQARRSLWLNLVITIPTGLLFYGLGTALFAYYATHAAELASVPAQADQLVPWFVVTQLPAGVAGLVIAGIFAAAMSSLDSSMNSISTVLVNDFIDRRTPPSQRPDRLRLARWLTVILGVIGTGAAMLLATFEIKYVFDLFQQIIGLFGGGLSGVFMLAVFTRRANATGAMTGLVAGGAATIAVAYGTELNFLLYAAVGSMTCVIVGYTVSRLTGGPQRDLDGLTLWTRSGAPS